MSPSFAIRPFSPQYGRPNLTPARQCPEVQLDTPSAGVRDPGKGKAPILALLGTAELCLAASENKTVVKRRGIAFLCLHNSNATRPLRVHRSNRLRRDFGQIAEVTISIPLCGIDKPLVNKPEDLDIKAVFELSPTPTPNHELRVQIKTNGGNPPE